MSRPIQNPRNAPPMPITSVPRNPTGSRPGTRRRAIAPTTSPAMTIQTMVAIAISSSLPGRSLSLYPGFARQPTRLFEDRFEHPGRELAREGVLLARVEAAQEHVGSDARLGAVAELRFRLHAMSVLRKRLQRTVPRERPERDD